MRILETERLILREITSADAAFILDLLNQPSFIRYIGDRGVRSVDDARELIENVYRKSYREHGFGLYAVELKNDFDYPAAQDSSSSERGAPLGICGFVKRDPLPAPDVGFALLPQHEKKGYAFESASAVMRYGRDVLGLKRVLAIASPDNESSEKLLKKLGFRLAGAIDHSGAELKLFSTDAE